MNEASIRRFLLELGADTDSIRVRKGWVNLRCPLAPYAHASGSDERPSFGIAINEDGPSVYCCFGCTPEPRLLGWLLHNMWLMSGQYPKEAAIVYREREIFDEDVLQAIAPDTWETEDRIVQPLAPEILRRFPLLQGAEGFEARRCREYLREERGIPDRVQNLCGVRYYADKQALIFPMTDVLGRTFVLRVRLRKEKRMWTVSTEFDEAFARYTFPTIHETGVWFGMHQINWEEPVLLVEGEIDAMKVMSYGFFNVMASATSSVSEKQLESLTASILILGYDADEAGRKAHNRIRRKLEGSCSLFVADWEKVGRKDPGALQSAAEFREVMDNLALF